MAIINDVPCVSPGCILGHYVCDNCESMFCLARPHEEALAEYKKNMPVQEARGDEQAIVCHDCYLKVMAWWEAQGKPDF